MTHPFEFPLLTGQREHQSDPLTLEVNLFSFRVKEEIICLVTKVKNKVKQTRISLN